MKKRVLIAATAILSITGGLLGKFLLEDDYTCVPLTYGKARCPIAPVKINGNTYPLELDLVRSIFSSSIITSSNIQKK